MLDALNIFPFAFSRIENDKPYQGRPSFPLDHRLPNGSSSSSRQRYNSGDTGAPQYGYDVRKIREQQQQYHHHHQQRLQQQQQGKPQQQQPPVSASISVVNMDRLREQVCVCL